MICPACKGTHITPAEGSSTRASCLTCMWEWDPAPLPPMGTIEEIDKAIGDGKMPRTMGELLEATKGPGLLTGAPDELPGIKAAVAGGDMDYVTDKRAEWMIKEIEKLREIVKLSCEEYRVLKNAIDGINDKIARLEVKAGIAIRPGSA